MATTKEVVFTVDWESYSDALHNGSVEDDRINTPTLYLLKVLYRYRVKAVFYVLRATRFRHPKLFELIRLFGHTIKSHGLLHFKWELADRRPYSWLGFTGGFYMRFFPYWFTKLNVLLHRQFYIHPHDLDIDHPIIENRLLNWKRHVGLKTAKFKLERLLEEVQFEGP